MTRPELEAIASAIRDAENGTTGRIAVRIVPEANVDAFERATAEFRSIGLHRHQSSNGAMVLVAPKARRFAVIGDRALHERVGPAFWQQIVNGAQPYFARGAVRDGIVHVVGQLGEALKMHFSTQTVGPAT